MLVSRRGTAFLFNTSFLPKEAKEKFKFEVSFSPAPGKPTSYTSMGGLTSSSSLNDFSWTLRIPNSPKYIEKISGVVTKHKLPSLIIPEAVLKLGHPYIHEIIGNLLNRTKTSNDPIQEAIADSIKAGIFPQYLVAEKDGKIGFYTAKELGINEDPGDFSSIDPRGPEFQRFLKDLFHIFQLEYMVN